MLNVAKRGVLQVLQIGPGKEITKEHSPRSVSHAVSMVRVRRSAESAHILHVACSCSAMSSAMFCELAALDVGLRSVLPAATINGTVHRVTVNVADSATCSFVSDAPAGCWVVLRQAPLGEVLPQADVLLVAVHTAKLLT